MSHNLLRDLRTLAICNLDVTSQIPESCNGSSGVQVFYTIHTAHNDLVYVSEVLTAYANADFGLVSLPDLERRIYKVRVSVWVKMLSKWVLFYRLKMDMRNLVEIGRSNRDTATIMQPNSLLWCINDVWFCHAADVRDTAALDSRKLSWSRPRVSKPSYSLDDIRQLTSLAISVQEFRDTKLKLVAQINALEDQNCHDALQQVRRLKFNLHALHRYIVKQNSANDALHSDVYAAKMHIGRCNRIIDEFPHFQDICTEQLAIAEAQIDPLHEALNASVYPSMISTLYSMGQVLRDIYPIEPSATGRFCICGIEFPSSTRELLDLCYYGERVTGQSPETDLETETEARPGLDRDILAHPWPDRINAALTYIVQLMQALASIMNVTVKYPMQARPGGCFIVDNVTMDARPEQKLPETHAMAFPLFYNAEHLQKFPLYEQEGRNFSVRNSPFELGLTLLNRNLAALINAITDLYAQYYHDDAANHLISNNIPADCLDNILWNLHYLLLFVTAPRGG